jgi:predicted nucleic acid-binding protein
MVIADTGFWLALLNRDDHHHSAAVAAHERLAEGLVTTWPVVTETCYLLLRHMGGAAQRNFVQTWIDGGFAIRDLGEDDARRLLRLMKDYADLPMDLADASLVVLAEHLGDGRILSTDERDFRTYRWKNHRPFRNLLLAS